MRPTSRANGVAFRRAVWASVALHVVVAVALVVFTRPGEPAPTGPGIDTRAEAQVRMSLPEVAVNVEVPAQAPAKPQAADPRPAAEPATSSTPLAASRAAPRTLSPELLALIRKPTAQPVVEAPGAPNPPAVDPNVKPAGGATAGAATASAIHGALDPNQTVVYVLDCSGSMGAAGKLEAARAALVSTLKQQPATVRFQIITYAGTAVPLLASSGNPFPANEANIRAAADKLLALEARGKSNHLQAVRAALAFRPDVILMLTDADDLNAAALKSIAASAPKPVSVRVGQVTAEGVQRSRELK